MRVDTLALWVALVGCSSGGGSQLPEPAPPEPVSPEPAPAEPAAPPLPVEARDAGRAQEPSPPAERRVVCRDEWGARPAKGEYRRHRVSKITVHHQGAVFRDASRAPARLRSMQAYHQGAEKRFADVSYHFVIDPAGKVFEGRPTWAAGETRTDYDPAGHLLVCLLGDFEKQRPTESQLEALVDMLAWASRRFGVAPETIAGHRDHARTSCPGKNLHHLIADGTIGRRVAGRLDDGGVDLAGDCAGLRGDRGNRRPGRRRR